MNAWLNDLLGRVLLPRLREAVEKEIGSQMDKYLPLLIHAVVQAITESAIKLSAEGADRLTDAIPGTLDDQVIDPLVKSILDKLSEFF